jgi:hypothetical protein
MLKHRDFVPKVLNTPRFMGVAWAGREEYEDLDDAEASAGAWIEQEKIQVVSVETVVLPNIWAPGEEGSEDPAIATQAPPTWHQFIRVWYREG